MDDLTRRAGRRRAAAVPARLAGWQGWAESQNEALRQAAMRLDAAIDALNRSRPSPDLLGRLDEVGEDVIRYVAANAATDAWVGAIGSALLDLARSRLPAEVAADAGNTAVLAGGLVTTTDARIAARVEPRAPDLEPRLAAARDLASRVAAALAAGDRTALARALTEVRRLGEEPEAAAAFFARLGPAATVGWAGSLETGLALGPVLAAASHAESWDPGFAEALFAGRPPSSLHLLALGEFDETFLAAAGDSWLLLGRDDEATAPDAEAMPVLDSLARNPDVALAFLVESSQGDADAALPQSRLTEILVRYATRLEESGALAAALGRVLMSAGAAPSGSEPYGGPFGDETLVGVLLFDLAAMPDGMVPDLLLPPVAWIVAHNLDGLLGGPPTGWAERTLRLALLDADGRPDPERSRQISTGFARWREAAAPHEHRPRTPANRRAWDRYLDRAGSLAGLLALVSGASFDAVLGEALTDELTARKIPAAPELARAARAFSEVVDA